MRKLDRLLILSVSALAVYFVLSLIVVDLVSPSIMVYNWILDFALVFGYFGAFLVAFLGNATFLIPIPYMIITFILGGLVNTSGQFLFDPLAVGLIAGLGATIGEMTGYLLGYGGSRFIEEKQRNAFSKFIEERPRVTPFIVWFLAISPLPDDFVILPLGAAKYPWWKVAIPQFIGKSMFMILAAWLGRLSYTTIGGLIATYDPTSIASRGLEVLALLSLIIALYLMLRIDWEKRVTITEEEEALRS
ncbi:MAG: VTT domain-containing protein [Candidatus Thorarchaeota archaeon]